MSAPRFVALTGPPQAGKGELRPVFDRLGLRFINLNEVGYRARMLAGTHRPAYDRLVPGCLHDNGRHRVDYFARLAEQPELALHVLDGLEIPLILDALTGILAELPDDGVITLLNWEYWHRALPFMRSQPFQHVLLLACEDRHAWYARLNARAVSRGWTGPRIPDAQLEQMIGAARCSLTEITATIGRHLRPYDYTAVNTSADDWGAAELERTLRRLGWI